MQYRSFGKLDWKPSALGFGAMRLPRLDKDDSHINEVEATRMVRWAIDHGLNYVDTAYVYHGGASEAFLGRALGDGYRQRVRLATKLPPWVLKSADDFDRVLDEQLERLKADYIDFYLLHSLDAAAWAKLQNWHVLRWAEKAMADGRFRYLGFSFHDTLAVFKKIVDAYDNWTFCQIQYNYMDEEHQAGTRGLHYAAEKGLGVVVMEPLRGGSLTRVPPHVQAVFDAAPVQRTPAAWGLRWVWSHPEVSLLLSGMSTLEQVQENVTLAGAADLGSQRSEELAFVARVRDALRERKPVPCTDCRYCQPCPNGVNIPTILRYYSDGLVYDEQARSKRRYSELPAEQHADQCLECGECEDKCPQHIAIVDELKRAQEWLT